MDGVVSLLFHIIEVVGLTIYYSISNSSSSSSGCGSGSGSGGSGRDMIYNGNSISIKTIKTYQDVIIILYAG